LYTLCCIFYINCNKGTFIEGKKNDLQIQQNTSYPIPVVRLIVADSAHRVLILKRSQGEYAPGEWCLPGGKVDYGDTVHQAVCRELEEETGLVCEDATFLFFQDSLPLKTGKMHCINFYFKCRVSGEISLNHESTQYAFLSSEDLERYSLVFQNDKGLLRYWNSL